jgi:homocysteine S-methyltransferase
VCCQVNCIAYTTIQPHPDLAWRSLPEYGAFLADGSEYRGNYTISEADLIAFHNERMHVLIEAGPDHIREVAAWVRAA